MEQIITVTELRASGRPIGKVDDTQLKAYITEAEQMLVKPVLGDALLVNIKTDEEETYTELLDGGTYTDAEGGVHSFTGLKVAISYYVYAQNIMVGDFQSTRYGMVIKDDDYSQHLSSKERSDAYNNALEIANQYMQDCVKYCKVKGFISKGGRSYTSGSTRIRKIG